jgi:hypothetical protein
MNLPLDTMVISDNLVLNVPSIPSDAHTVCCR